MTEKRRFLLDANVIVYAYEIEVWEHMHKEAEIVTSASIIQDEAKFYSREYDKVMINLPELVDSGELKEVDPKVSQVNKVTEKFDELFSEQLHEGEIDLLAHLLSIEDESTGFCSADRVALEALAMLGLGDLGISLEEILRIIGYQKSDINSEYTQAYLEECLEEGKQKRITGLGLADTK